MRDNGLQMAIDAMGGISALSRALGIAQPSVSNWQKVPADRVIALEALSSISRHDLRPDLYPQDEKSEGPAPHERIRGEIYLLLANLLQKTPHSALLLALSTLEAGTGEIGAAVGRLAQEAQNTSLEKLERAYFDLFIGVGRGEFLPYASYYRTGFLYERPLVRVREDLKQLGLEKDASISEPEDHIGFLCEMMASFALQRYPVPAGFERRFFTRHLDNWAPQFFTALEASPTSAFYAAVGHLGRLFLDIERAAFALEPEAAPANTNHHSSKEDRHENGIAV